MRHALALSLACASGLLACAGTPPRAEVARTCEGLTVTMEARIPVEWSGALSTAGRGTAIVEWCGPGSVVVDSVEVGEHEQAHASYALDPAASRLDPGGRLRVSITGSGQPGNDPILVRAIADDGRTIEARGEVLTVDDPDRVAAIAACDACGGRWGAVGLSGNQTCDCPTTDAGQRCIRGSDCQGGCIRDGDELAPAGEGGPVCAPGEELRRWVGHCHDHQLMFGCHPRIDEVELECVRPGAARRHQMVCVD